MKGLTYKDDTHQYFLDGVEIPGITSVLKRAGIVGNYPCDCDETPGCFCPRCKGTKIHKAIEFDCKSTLDFDSLDVSMKPYILGWRDFCKAFDYHPEYYELKVFSRSYRYAGRIDTAGKLKDKFYLVEIKTGAKHPTHKLQTAAQSFAFTTTENKNVDGRLCVYLKDDGTYSAVEHDDGNDIVAFIGYLNTQVWESNNGIKKGDK